MRIAQIYPHARICGDPPTASDAISIVQLALCRELADRHAVLAVVRRFPGEREREPAGGFELARIAPGPDRLLNLGRLLDGRLFPWQRPFRTRGLYGRFFARHTVRLLREWRPDVVHLHGTAAIAPVLARGLPAVPLLLHVHDHSLAELDHDWAARCLGACERVLCCSGFVAERLRARFPDLAPRIRVLWNGVDEVFLGRAADTGGSRDLLFAGRLAPEKGVHLLIEAFARIAPSFPESRLRLVGPDSSSPPEFVDPEAGEAVTAALRRWTTDPKAYARHLRALAAPLGDRVRFEGPTDYRGVAAAMREAAVFAFPSLWHEPFGMPVVEAMAAGLPVVATRAGAFPETVEDGRSGLLVERGDVDGLAGALARLLARPDLRRRMAAAGRERAFRLFTWPAIARQLEEAYASARQASAKARARSTTSEAAAPGR
jgi:glycosyltransferase involved in cell wall biosynthesis